MLDTHLVVHFLAQLSQSPPYEFQLGQIQVMHLLHLRRVSEWRTQKQRFSRNGRWQIRGVGGVMWCGKVWYGAAWSGVEWSLQATIRLACGKEMLNKDDI